jgi:meiotically up-regulated gene 157 (Mug157) protein
MENGRSRGLMNQENTTKKSSRKAIGGDYVSEILLTKEKVLELVKEKMKGRTKIIEMFQNCYQNTLETTIRSNPQDNTVFMLTGDIPAMWLRDSVNQLRPYLLVAKGNEEIQEIVEGVLKKQFQCIMLDPYANAFNNSDNHAGHQEDETFMKPEIWERKYEIDSLCYPIQLAYLYWKNTDKTVHFNELCKDVMKTILSLWKVEQHHMEKSPYNFKRNNCPESDTLPNAGKGNPVSYTGMTWSGFRPSDDSCVYGYLVPSNMFAIVVLGYMEEINHVFYHDEALHKEIVMLKESIQKGIDRYAIVETEDFGEVYAYEVDGKGNYLLMDDANVPSLLSMPYFHYCDKDNLLYKNTRNLILSKTNPYYYEGKFAKGIGSPHTPMNYIWHIALSIQGITAAEKSEQEQILDYFERTDAGTNLVHEGFDKDNPNQYTREWFSWSNAMFVEFVLSMCSLKI